MTINRSMFSRPLKSGAAGLAVATLATMGIAGAAHADNLTWSLGLSSPGGGVGVSNAQPGYGGPLPVVVQPQRVYVQPQPVYVQPQPVYVQPRPVYVQPQVVYQQHPQVVYVQPAPQVVYPGWRHHERRDHRWEHRGRHQPMQSAQPVHYPPQVVMPTPVHGYGHHWR